jgi:hypothetical protein
MKKNTSQRLRLLVSVAVPQPVAICRPEELMGLDRMQTAADAVALVVIMIMIIWPLINN